ncbi:MAG: hypothetical protein H7124_05430 [Phycisphaerales bacterium]|nr:hypothetical protein [Hyphomonadaceae bacterium]
MPSRDDDILNGLPDKLRSSGQPIVIYQGVPPEQAAAQATNNALGLLFWLFLITLCLMVAGVSAWAMWNPNHANPTDRGRWFSPIYAEGRPLGLNKLIEERERINAAAAGLSEYRDDVSARRELRQPHPLITGTTDSIDTLRQQWDDSCRDIRRQIYQNRLDAIEANLLQLRRRIAVTTVPADRAALTEQRRTLEETRRQTMRVRDADGDPALSCVRAVEADMCGRGDHDPWCDGGDDVFNRRRR